MKRIIASIGLLLLACQVALGSAGAIFLCLCASSEAECAPPAPTLLEDDCCAHSEEKESAQEKEECSDLLLTTDDLDSVEFNKETTKLLTLVPVAIFELPELYNLASLFEQQPPAARAPPEIASPQTLYTQTIKLLL
ncbi:hypothetical protein [Pelagicoccus mobilis]|uniref:Secreted protein n=1 Tax=Pelagicoccus mobilis TaxID=415221 RepID=A0A934S3D6_9BACT|nr:hypothetical protein [Pelagicoccus mobilis]MBK1879931.1 hypothetical protein [Pelagicoccus mobilis]